MAHGSVSAPLLIGNVHVQQISARNIMQRSIQSLQLTYFAHHIPWRSMNATYRCRRVSLQPNCPSCLCKCSRTCLSWMISMPLRFPADWAKIGSAHSSLDPPAAPPGSHAPRSPQLSPLHESFPVRRCAKSPPALRSKRQQNRHLGPGARLKLARSARPEPRYQGYPRSMVAVSVHDHDLARR